MSGTTLPPDLHQGTKPCFCYQCRWSKVQQKQRMEKVADQFTDLMEAESR